MSEKTNRSSDKFMLRLPDGMRDRIKVAALENGRSMNQEIVIALEEKYPPVSEGAQLAYEMLAAIDEMSPLDRLFYLATFAEALKLTEHKDAGHESAELAKKLREDIEGHVAPSIERIKTILEKRKDE